MLSANQIIAILHAKPEVIVDLKQVMVSYFFKQGIAVQEDSITDEILFSNLASNAGLREAISVWLRARGYASDEDFAEAPMANPDQQTPPQDLSTEKSRDAKEITDDKTDGASQLTLALRDLPPDSELLPQDSSNPALNNNRLDRNIYPGDENREMGNMTKQPTAGRPPSPSTNLKKREPVEPAEVEILHKPAPYNLQALRDLYTQLPEQSAKVKRFGSDVFLYARHDDARDAHRSSYWSRLCSRTRR